MADFEVSRKHNLLVQNDKQLTEKTKKKPTSFDSIDKQVKEDECTATTILIMCDTNIH